MISLNYQTNIIKMCEHCVCDHFACFGVASLGLLSLALRRKSDSNSMKEINPGQIRFIVARKINKLITSV